MLNIMASSSGGNTSGNSLQDDQRKRKRMQSNRESAKRSRMRKQKHLDDLTAEVARISNENKQILNCINANTDKYLSMEAENLVLKAQLAELTQRLQSLDEISSYIKSSSGGPTTATGSCVITAEEFEQQGFGDGFLNNPWSLVRLNQHPIMASADMLDY